MGLKPRIAFTALRVAVTGRRVSPPLFESMEIMGKEKVVSRIEKHLKK
jgi:glutamyl-tRNA synthetase